MTAAPTPLPNFLSGQTMRCNELQTGGVNSSGRPARDLVSRALIGPAFKRKCGGNPSFGQVRTMTVSGDVPPSIRRLPNDRTEATLPVIGDDDRSQHGPMQTVGSFDSNGALILIAVNWVCSASTAD